MWVTLFFFFSSRRRHTRWTGDWSSDVCSSDLVAGIVSGQILRLEGNPANALALINRVKEKFASLAQNDEYSSLLEDATLETAYCLVDMGMFDEAYSILADAERFDLTKVDRRKLQLNKGVCLARQEKPKPAKTELTLAIDEAEDDIALFARFELAR